MLYENSYRTGNTIMWERKTLNPPFIRTDGSGSKQLARMKTKWIGWQKLDILW